MDIDESPKYQFIFVMDKYLCNPNKNPSHIDTKTGLFQYFFEGFYRYAQSDCIYEYLDKLSSLIFLYEL